MALREPRNGAPLRDGRRRGTRSAPDQSPANARPADPVSGPRPGRTGGPHPWGSRACTERPAGRHDL